MDGATYHETRHVPISSNLVEKLNIIQAEARRIVLGFYVTGELDPEVRDNYLTQDELRELEEFRSRSYELFCKYGARRNKLKNPI